MSAEEVARAFVTHFYGMFTQGMAQIDHLANLYQPTSMFSIENQKFSGPQAIIGKYKSLGTSLAFNPATMDVQPSVSNNAMIVVITGKLKIDNDNDLHYLQVFQLVSTAQGSYYVNNDVLRLIYG